MSIISGFPRGLLDLLGSQNFGEAPRELGGIVSPVIDIGDLYLSSKLSVDVSIIAPNVTNGTNNASAIAVPAGETWYVHAFAVFCSTGVGEAARITPVVTINGGTMACGDRLVLGASEGGYVPMSIAPFWAPSGARLQLFAGGVVGVPFGSITAMVAKLKG